MFTQIRNRLTFFYTVMMILFVLAFVGTTYASLAWVLFYQQKQEVLLFAEEEAREFIEHLRQAASMGLPPSLLPSENGGALFSFVYDLSGRQIVAVEPATQLHSPVLELIRGGNVLPREVKLEIITTPDNQTYYVMLTSQPIESDSQVLGIVYVGMDITSYYEVLRTVLYIMLGMCLAFLIVSSGIGHLLAARAMKAVSLAFDRQREFVADASHELRTPLSVLLASVETVQDSEKNQLSPFSQQVLADMKDEVLRMSKIVGGLLTLARGDSVATKLIKADFDISTLAAQVTRTLEPFASKTKISLTLSARPGLSLTADYERIEQLLFILLDNALKNTPAGGSVTLTVTSNSKYVLISVQDTGTGIAKEEQARIFERFYRVDKARSRETGGTGLGLAIAHWIVQAHTGTIEVKSELGRGSNFIVTLPRK